VIADRFQPLEPARAGTPQRARDRRTAQTVMLRDVLLPSEGAAAAVQRARAAAGIFHPSLITLFDAIDVGSDRLLLAYEFVPSQTLKQLSGGQPFHPRRAAELMAEIADAAAELHARGFVHGAITSETVLITMKGKAKLDRVGDPSLPAAADIDETADLHGIISVLRELTKGASGTLPALDVILTHDDGAAFGSAATLAASLRAASARPPR
jgi:serine/threonine protein kinase